MPRLGERKRIKPPCFIRVDELKSLARLACAFERAPLPVFSLEVEGSTRLAVQLDLFMGRPVFYYAVSNESREFVGYRNSGGIEEVFLADSTLNPSYIYAPIISVQRLPVIFRQGLRPPKRGYGKFLSIRVKDLPSMAKVCSYKTVFEEPPLPLFSFPTAQGWVIGAFTRVDEYEDASIFFYLLLDSAPAHSFLRFSTRTASDAAFTNRIDEHGYVFVKIIRLSEAHPLVEIEE